jgi:hypothetical protein
MTTIAKLHYNIIEKQYIETHELKVLYGFELGMIEKLFPEINVVDIVIIVKDTKKEMDSV